MLKKFHRMPEKSNPSIHPQRDPHPLSSRRYILVGGAAVVGGRKPSMRAGEQHVFKE
jgi:hypothetical protein